MGDQNAVKPLRGRVTNQPVGRVAERRAQHKDVATGNCRVVGEGQNIDARLGGGKASGIRGLGIKRADDDPRAIVDRLGSHRRGLLRVASGVVDAQVNRHAVQVGNCHTCCVFKVLRQKAVGRLT